MRLLLVEDDGIIAQTVLGAMRRVGYAIDWAEDGRTADLSLGDGAYDLVLLDLSYLNGTVSTFSLAIARPVAQQLSLF